VSTNPRAFGPPPQESSFQPGQPLNSQPRTGLARLSSGGGEFRSATAMESLPSFRSAGLARLDGAADAEFGGGGEESSFGGGRDANPFSFDLDNLFGGDTASPNGPSNGLGQFSAPRERKPVVQFAEGPEIKPQINDVDVAAKGVKIGQQGVKAISSATGLGRLGDAPFAFSDPRLPGVTFPTHAPVEGVETFANPGAGLGAAGTVGNVANLLGAGLNLAGGLTGNEDLSKAGFGASALGTGLGIYAGATSPAVASAASGAGTAAGAGLGAAGGALAGGVLAIPALVQQALQWFAPDWLGPSHYEKTRTKEDYKAQAFLGRMNQIYEMAQSDPRYFQAALQANYGPINTRFNDRPFGEMSQQELSAALTAIQQNPELLQSITADAGAIPYVDERNKAYFAGEAADYTRNLIAKALGLPYDFMPVNERVRDYHGFYKDVRDDSPEATSRWNNERLNF
jgi:hypothetical protein